MIVVSVVTFPTLNQVYKR